MKTTCRHIHFKANVVVNRVLEDEGQQYANSFSVDLSVICMDCQEKFVFLGLAPGYSTAGARSSVDQLEARLAIMPETNFRLLPAKCSCSPCKNQIH